MDSQLSLQYVMDTQSFHFFTQSTVPHDTTQSFRFFTQPTVPYGHNSVIPFFYSVYSTLWTQHVKKRTRSSRSSLSLRQNARQLSLSICKTCVHRGATQSLSTMLSDSLQNPRVSIRSWPTRVYQNTACGPSNGGDTASVEPNGSQAKDQRWNATP